jgi:hypothetical protein
MKIRTVNHKLAENQVSTTGRPAGPFMFIMNPGTEDYYVWSLDAERNASAERG